MTYDPNCGHFRGAAGTPRGFEPAQGSGGDAPSTLLNNIRNWWKLDDDGTWTDAVTTTNYWTENNSPTTTTGKINYGIDFAYTGGYSGPYLSATNAALDVGDGTSEGDKSITVTGWVYQDVGTGARGKTALHWNYGFYLNTGHPGATYTLRVNCYMNGLGWKGDSLLSTPTVQTGAWNFVFMRYYNLTDTPTAGSISYHCGIVTDSGLTASTPVTHSSGYKGNTAECKMNYPGYELQGTLDLVGIWTRALTDAELIELYATTNGGTDYPFS